MIKSKIFGDALFSSVRVSASILRGIILIPIITKLLGESAFGTWVALMAIISVVTAVGGLHLHGAMIRFTPVETKKGQTLVDIMTLGIFFALLFGVGVYVLGGTFGLVPHTNQNKSILTATSALVGVRIVTTILKNYPRACNQVKIFELIWLVQLLLESALLGIVFWQYQSLTLGLWTLVGLSSLISIVLGGYYLPREIRVPDISSFSRYIRYGVPMVPKEMGSGLLSNADKYLLAFLGSPAVVAVYAVSYSVAGLLRNLTDPLNSTLYPAVTTAWDNENFSDLRNLYRQIFRWYTVIGIPAVFGISILSKPLLILISTKTIAMQGMYILPVLAIGFFLRGYDNPLSYIINATKENNKLATVTIITAMINVALNIALIPTFSVFGAVFATFVSQVVMVGYIYKECRTKIELQFPSRTVVRSLIAATMMTAFLVFQPFALSATLKLTLFPIVGGTFYLLALIGAGELTREDVRLVLSIIEGTPLSGVHSRFGEWL